MKAKKITALVLTLLLALSVAGCGGKQESTTISESGKNLSHKLSDKPIEMTYFARQFDGYEEENIFNYAFDLTNVRLKASLSENVSDMDQALALAVAARDIPDIIYDWNRTNFVKYGMQGALIPLNDLIDKHAPNIKKFLDENPDILHYCTAGDGNIYFIPFVQAGDVSVAWCMRGDWLEKVGKEAPTNLEELEEVWKAFRDGDPNGNGIKDEVPFFGNTDNIIPLLSFFNSGTKFKYDMDKKEAVFAPMEDNFKEAMITIKRWYDEGLIDPEIYTRKDARTYFCSNNIGGTTHNWLGSTLGTNAAYAPKFEGYNMIAIAPPEGSDGVRRQTVRRARMTGEGWGISAMNENPELTMQYFDFWWTEEGSRLVNFGKEGVHYDMVDGAPVVKEEVLNNPDLAANVLMASMRHKTNFGFAADFGFESQWASNEALDAMEMYEEYVPSIHEVPMLAYSAEDEKTMKELKIQIETYIAETMQKWILVGGDIESEFETFKKQLKALDVDKYVKIENKAYKEYLSVVNK